MSTVLDGLYYSESHEWLKVEGEFGYIGITAVSYTHLTLPTTTSV